MTAERKTSILIIDDNMALLESLAAYLEDREFRVLTARNGREGLDALEREKPDLVLTDLRMPEVDGLEVLRRAGETAPDVPTIVVSGTGRMADTVQALKFGAWDYVLKPIEDMAVVAHAVNRALERARLLREERDRQRLLEDTVRDRTAELEKALKNVGEIIEHNPMAIQIVDRDGRTTRVNGAYVRMFGAPPPPEYSVYDEPQLQNPALAALVRRAQEGEVVRFPDLVFNPRVHGPEFSDRQIWLRTMAFPLRDAQGRPERYVLMHEDVTERKRAEEEGERLQMQLAHSQKMESVGRLAGGVAHDFNNMLAVILGNVEMALEGVDAASPLHAELVEVRRAAERSADLTRQLLAFARKQTVAPKVLDFNDTVGGMLKMLRRLIGENVELKWNPGKDAGQVKIDPTQIDQILVNLCVNARDAIGEKGTICIETDRAVLDESECFGASGAVPGDYLRLSVSDDGCGMDAETAAHAFEPFFTTKSVGEGTGLGLATVYGIVKQNGGFVGVYSEPGVGTVFKVYLPRHVAQAEAAAAVGGEVAKTPGTETILLVEDEPSILRMVKNLLERRGYAVLAASKPGEAIRLAERHPTEVQLLITDVVMPEMNGRDLARNLLAQHPGLRRLFMSGHSADVLAHHGVLDEGVHFIQKPFTMRALQEKIAEALADLPGSARK